MLVTALQTVKLIVVAGVLSLALFQSPTELGNRQRENERQIVTNTANVLDLRGDLNSLQTDEKEDRRKLATISERLVRIEATSDSNHQFLLGLVGMMSLMMLETVVKWAKTRKIL